MTFASPLASGSTAGTAVFVMNIDGPTAQVGAPLGDWGTATFGSHWTWTDGIIYDRFGTTLRKTCGSLSDRNDARVASQVSATSVWTLWLNGAQFFTTGTNTVGWSAVPKLGLAALRYWNGNLGCVAFLPSQASDPLRKRLEHAAAFSFKISCN